MKTGNEKKENVLTIEQRFDLEKSSDRIVAALEADQWCKEFGIPTAIAHKAHTYWRVNHGVSLNGETTLKWTCPEVVRQIEITVEFRANTLTINQITLVG